MLNRKPLQWTVGFSKAANTPPTERVPATVPGAVQLDWAKAHDWSPYYYAENWKEYRWMEDVYWIYATKLELPPLAAGERVSFVCKGVDYRFQVRLKGQTVHEQEGMFTPFEVDLGAAQNGDTFEIVVFPAPKSCEKPVDRNQANQSVKPAVSYEWDFHPRLVPLGIWDAAYLEVRPAQSIRAAETRYELSADLSAAGISVDVEVDGTIDGLVVWELLDAAGACVCQQRVPAAAHTAITAALQKPKLWWPNGQGEQTLYTSRISLTTAAGALLDQREARVGFRRVRLVMNPGAWDLPIGHEFPKGPSNPPITMEVNGRSIFCKGSNWVGPDIFPGTVTAETYRPLLDLVKSANMNMLRLWGGAAINKDAFYEMCDVRGIMIWQEFPLACNRYEGTPAYLRVLDQESKSIIRKLRPHACIVMWCGGNELFNNWSLMTNQDLALRLLNRNCYDLDPQRPFLMTSPIMGMGHGHYLFRDPRGNEVFQLMTRARCSAYTEFGCPGPASVQTLKKIIPESELFPPRRGTSWVSHHAFDAWGADSGSWLMLHQIEDYFGACQSLEDVVHGGQLLQGEGYKCIFEEARRQKPSAAMALNWCFNEPWPTAANNSLISWPAEPKRAYAEVAKSCRPVLASARIPKFRWKEGEVFDPELWLLNDSPARMHSGRIDAYLVCGAEKIALLSWDFPALEPNVNLAGPVIRFPLPSLPHSSMKLVLTVPGRAELGSDYTLVYVPVTRRAEHAGARALNM